MGTMAKHPTNQNPEGVNAIWRAVHKLEGDVEDLVNKIPKPSAWNKGWSWAWKERNWLIPVLIVLIGTARTGAYKITSLVLDARLKAAIDPTQKSVDKINALPLQNIGQMSEDIAAIKSTLNAWSPLITPQVLKKSATLSKDEFEKSLPELNAVVHIATQSRTLVSSEDVSDIGKRTLALSEEKSSIGNLAWETTTSLVQYRSFLNSLTPPPNINEATPISNGTSTTRYFVQHKVGDGPQFSTLGIVPKDQAAALNLIGQDFNASMSEGSGLLIGDGGNIYLDGMQLKNVVLINVHVSYDGGPVVLEHVYFINCIFDIKQSPNSHALSGKLIEPAPTTYSLPAS